MYLDWSSERATYEAKIASISSEVAAWKALVTSQTPTVSFARHQSQVLRLSTIFEKIVENLTQRVSALNESDPIKLKRSVNNAILQAGQFWSYFESKLLTRYAAHTANFLLAADEFAWACLTDLNDARLGDANFVRKSPPLIYLGPNFSPFVIPADWSIKNQIAGVNDQLFEQFTRSIPFSVLGLPFYQTAHLPEIMVLAHEIGHVIDFDLGLTKTLDVCLDSLPASVLST